MDRFNLSKLSKINQWLVSMALVLVILQTPVVVWLWSKFPNQALIFKSVADVVILASFAISLYLIVKHWSKFKQYQTILILVGVYILLTALSGLFTWGQWQSLMAGLVINLRYVLILISSLTLGVLDRTWFDKVVKTALALGLVVGVFALLQVTVLPRDFLRHFGYSKNTIQPYLVIDQNDAYVRINSTLRGPNPLGALAVIMLALGLSRFYQAGKIKQADKLNLVMVFLAGLALLNSHSRSAWLAGVLVIAALLVFYFKSARRQLVIWSVVAGLALGAMGLAVLWIKDDNHSLVDEFQHLFLHDNSATGNISSDVERQGSITTALDLIKDRPVFGHGVGSAGSASLMRQDGKELIIENQFLFIAYEVGLVGLAVFLSLYGLVLANLFKLRQSWQALGLLISGVGLGVIGLFLPVLVDSAVAVTWWALAGAAISQISYNKKRYAKSH